jgi:competence protein ComEC
LATLPIVAWHFEQVSVVGIPATLLAGPLVAVALPGAIASVAVDFVSSPMAAFLAGGVGWLLLAFEEGAVALGSFSWAAMWTTKVNVAAATLGVLLATVVARRPWIGARARRWLTVTYVAAAVLAWPVALSHQGRGQVEILMIDVGQGDAVAIRGPDGRWILVDAGPPVASAAHSGGHPVVRALRARGVQRLEALVLTHADLDHVGGARDVLRAFDVGLVLDPALPAGKEAFVEALETARARSVPWRAATTGMRLSLGDLSLDVLSPDDSLRATDPEANEASVVLLARLGRFEALLTGDAYKPLERSLAAALPSGIEVLKVGHHGSDTSTDPELLDRASPRVALISAGRRNRYGHPAPQVLDRLESRGMVVWRTDEDGTVRVVGSPDGRFVVRAWGR